MLNNFKEIKENDFNLNVRRYIENGDEEEEIDVPAVRDDLAAIEKERAEIDKKVEKFLEELKY